MKLKLPTLGLTTVMALAVAGGTAIADERSSKIDLSKTFRMQVQTKPMSEPKNSAYRWVDVNCALMTLNPRTGRPIPSAQFVAQFDPNGTDFPPAKRAHDPNFAPGMQHIGGGSPRSHQICVSESEVFSGRGKSYRETKYTMDFRGTTYYLSAPYGDYRFCAVWAAAAACTHDTADDKKIPDFYKTESGGNMIINPETLQEVENEPQYIR